MAFMSVNELSTSKYTVTISDEDGDLITSLDSLELTFCTTVLATEINGRTDQDILNANNVVFSGGTITWSMQQADNAIIDGLVNPEAHLATFDAKWNSGTARKTWTADFLVKNLAKITI